MPTLAPTVHERLARCGERVFVDGLVTNADVVLSVDGVEFAITAGGAGHNFVVPPLAVGAIVKAKQDEGAGFSPWSPDVVVEDAAVPPTSGPALPDEVGACSQCVLVTNMVPSCQVELRIGDEVVGQGLANRHGEACVAVDLRKLKGRPGPTLTARMIVCGVTGPSSAQPITAETALPKPQVHGPLFGCQNVVPVSNLRRGARCGFESDQPSNLGSFCSCWTAATVHVVRALIVGEQVRAQGYWDAKPCDDQGDPSEWEPVVAPDDRIKPIVLEALVEGDQTIRVDNQISGASLVIRIRPDDVQPAVEFGPRPASLEQEIDLNAPLQAGNIVSVVQTLCGVSRESDPVVVLPLPPVVEAPVIVPPLVACARSVQVSNLHPGALVRVFMDGIPIGVDWAGTASSIAVTAAPALVASAQVTARQEVGSIVSPDSAPVTVSLARAVRRPRILAPLALGDTTVWVSNVVPGSHLIVESGGAIIGSADATESIARIGVTPVTGDVSVTARLCRRTSESASAEPIVSPCASRKVKVGEKLLSYPTWHVPVTADGGDFDMPFEGQLYFPSSGGNNFARNAKNLPLVIIAHGYWAPGVESFKGYDYLASHLVQWGMVVFSLNMDEVNGHSVAVTNTQQYSRGEIILHAIDLILGDPDLKGRIDPQRIGLVGHSMGGEGVVVAQLLNESEGRGYGIGGVVSIAPTRWRPEVVLRSTKYMQIFGSLDQLTGAMTGSDAAARFSGFRIYDRAWRPKTHFWVYGLRHNPFNRIWPTVGDTFEEHLVDIARPAGDHERLARCLINGFFQDSLLGQSAYAGYMEGTVFPRSLTDFEIHTQHSKDSRVVLDNFGDLDEQVPLAAEALNTATNSLGQGVSGDPTLMPIADVEHTAIARSPHNTKGVELGWSQDAAYTTGAGGLAGALTHVIAMRIGQFYQDDNLNPVAADSDAFVVLHDGANEAAVRLGAVAPLPYPDSAGVVLCPMRTVRLPLDAFKAVNPALNLANIQSVSLRFAARPSGHILADDVEIGA